MLPPSIIIENRLGNIKKSYFQNPIFVRNRTNILSKNCKRRVFLIYLFSDEAVVDS
jgi:hypothetical protein